MNSYRELDIYKMAYALAIKVHKMTMTLPNYELYEQGSQVRRSTKSIKDNIVEGYGRNRYKNEFVKFLVYAHSSCDEAISQLTMIDEIHFESKNLIELINEYDTLGRKINKFIDYVDNHWNETNTEPGTRNT
ncbi:MAG: four helix bundle protein [Draconibacterium sp.]